MLHTVLMVLWALYSCSYGSDIVRQSLMSNCQSYSACNCNATCVPIKTFFNEGENISCFGTPLSYSLTSKINIGEETNYPNLNSRLKQWEVMNTIPKCWKYLQSFLCSVYLPPCSNSRVNRTDRSLCKLVNEHCHILNHKAFQPLPTFFNCSQYDLCPTKSDRFIPEGKCIAPFVTTSDKRNWFPGFPGCGLQCKSPLYSEADYDYVRSGIALMSMLAFIVNFWISLSCLLTNDRLSRFPKTSLFYMHPCFCLGSIGWFLQYPSDTFYSKIVCNADGAVRIGESNPFGAAPCLVTFILIFFSFMMALSLACVFAYILQSHLKYLCIRASRTLQKGTEAGPNLNSPPDNAHHQLNIDDRNDISPNDDVQEHEEITSKSAVPQQWVNRSVIESMWIDMRRKIPFCGCEMSSSYLYFMAFLLPFVLFIACMAIDLLDASPIHGICLISNRNFKWKLMLAIIPVVVCFIMKSGFFITAISYLWKLCGICRTSNSQSDKLFANRLITTAYRFIVFVSIQFVILFTGIAIDIYNVVNENLWQESLKDFLLCNMSRKLQICPSEKSCSLMPKPSRKLILLQVVMYFAVMPCYWSLVFGHARRASLPIIQNFIARIKRLRSSTSQNPSDSESPVSMRCEIQKLRIEFCSWWDLGLFQSINKNDSIVLNNQRENSGEHRTLKTKVAGDGHEENIDQGSVSSFFPPGGKTQNALRCLRKTISYHSDLMSLDESRLTDSSINSMSVASTPGQNNLLHKKLESKRIRKKTAKKKQEDRMSRAMSNAIDRSNSLDCAPPNKSKISLRSACSYNSYEQVGGCWCETARTRAVLMNALRWANTFMPSVPHNCSATPVQPCSGACYHTPSSIHTSPLNCSQQTHHQSQVLSNKGQIRFVPPSKPQISEKCDSDEYDSEDETVSIPEFNQEERANGERPDSDSFCSDDEANSEHELKQGKDIELMGANDSMHSPQHKDI